MSGGNMDDQYSEMMNFRDCLATFNEHLQRYMHELEAEHSKVSPDWQDQWRRDYDAVWVPFEETMKRYINAEGPNYLEFLNHKIQALRRYLYGS